MRRGTIAGHACPGVSDTVSRDTAIAGSVQKTIDTSTSSALGRPN
jgi:hypothetical protein